MDKEKLLNIMRESKSAEDSLSRALEDAKAHYIAQYQELRRGLKDLLTRILPPEIQRITTRKENSIEVRLIPQNVILFFNDGYITFCDEYVSNFTLGYKKGKCMSNCTFEDAYPSDVSAYTVESLSELKKLIAKVHHALRLIEVINLNLEQVYIAFAAREREYIQSLNEKKDGLSTSVKKIKRRKVNITFEVVDGVVEEEVPPEKPSEPETPPDEGEEKEPDNPTREEITDEV